MRFTAPICMLLLPLLLSGLTPTFAQDDSLIQPHDAPKHPPAPILDPAYSQAATNDLLQKIYAILDYNSLMNPKFLENTLGVKFTVFPENYGPEKVPIFADIEFSAGKNDPSDPKKFMSVDYRVYLAGIPPLGERMHENFMATLTIGWDLPDVCILADAFDSRFPTPRQDKGKQSLPHPYKNYWFDRRPIDENYYLNFGFGVDYKSGCVTHVSLNEAYDHPLPPIPQPGDPDDSVPR